MVGKDLNTEEFKIMRINLGKILMLSFLCSCGASPGGRGSERKQPNPADADQPRYTEIPNGEKEVFSDVKKTTFAKAKITCDQSGYGYALDDKLNRISVCCVALSQETISQDNAKFVTKNPDKIVVKPAKCDAAVVTGQVGDVALPIDLDATDLRYLSLKSNMAGATGLLTITGRETLNTKLVGNPVQTFFGKTTLSNINIIGSRVIYYIRDMADFNSLTMKNVAIESDDVTKSQLVLSSSKATSIGITGTKMNFDHVQITADQSNPVLLDGFPFNTSGVEILPGKKYAPHIGFQGKYFDNTGILSDTRYPILPHVDMIRNSHLRVAPGITIKLPEEHNVYGFYGTNYSLEITGTSDKHVTITGSKDDSVGGDTNGDGNLSTSDAISLVGNYSGYQLERANSIAVHFADLKGVSLFAAGTTPVALGNVTFKPSEGGKKLNVLIGLYSGISSSHYPSLTLDGPVEAWHDVETYNDGGRTRVKTAIYAEHWSDWATQGGSVKGLNLLTVHNTSSSPQRINEDLRVLGENKGTCGKVENDAGQVTAEMKSLTYYINDTKILKCE